MAFSLISIQVSQNVIYIELTSKKALYWHLNGEHITGSDLSTLLRSQKQREPIHENTCVCQIGERTRKSAQSQRKLSHQKDSLATSSNSTFSVSNINEKMVKVPGELP